MPFSCVSEPETGTEPTDPGNIKIPKCNRYQEGKKGGYGTTLFVPKSKYKYLHTYCTLVINENSFYPDQYDKHFILLIGCSISFQNEKQYTAKEQQIIINALDRKDAKACSSKCEKSNFCVAHLITQNPTKSGAKTTGYGCRLYYKNSKGLEKEVPICKAGKCKKYCFLISR